jgi:hypothetical protein
MIFSPVFIPKGLIDLVINSKGSTHLNKEENPLGSVYIPCVKGISESWQRIGNHYNSRNIFKTKRTLTSSLMKTRQERGPK